MCGIAGAIYRDGRTASEAVLAKMANELVHRGPDGFGVRAFEGGGLSHRRLSILDLSDAAAQPMGASNGSWIVFNGEIYNFKELREQLEGFGHRFCSSGDTEVILKGFLQWGVGVIARLDGMFALAIWDANERSIILARDRTGKKPLYIYQDGQKLVFGSEIKAILAHPDVDTETAGAAFAQYLTFGYTPTPTTFYRRISKLPPATYCVVRADRWASTPETYWALPTSAARSPRNLDEAKEELRSLFFAAVRRRMVADVPLGAFLSGGIDSTLVVAAMSHIGGTRIKTFCVGFPEHPQFDESRYARIVAERYGTSHTELRAQPDSVSLLDKIAWHYDEPFGDSSAIPTFLVSQMTREHVKVALTGDGGDEAFAGYPRFVAAALAERLPRLVRRTVGRAARWLPTYGRHGGRLQKVRRIGLQIGKDLPGRTRGWINYFTVEELRTLLVRELAAEVTEQNVAASFNAQLDVGSDVANNLLLLNFRTYLLDDLNVKVDRSSMAASLETRSPFLDTKLLEFAFRLPGDWKARWLQTKWILKQAMADLIPEPLRDRKKMGFGMPLGAWFRGDLNTEIRSRLLDNAEMWRVIRKEAVEKILKEHESGLRDRGMEIWALLMLGIWLTRTGASQIGS